MSKRSHQPKPPRGKTDSSRTRASKDGLTTWVAAAVLAVSIGAVYAPSCNAPFIFDDIDTIIRNDSIKTDWPLIGTDSQPGPLNPPANIPTAARPLVNLSFAINYKFGELNPIGYHAVNVVIHFLSAMLLYSILRHTLRLPFFAGRFDSAAAVLALATALIWALHPLQTEAVIYATQRTELMMGLFYLATLHCCIRYWEFLPRPAGQRLWAILAVLACLAGMASKEVMVSAPLIVLLFDRTFIAGTLGNALRKSWPLYAALAATWILLVWLSAGSPHSGAAGFELGPPAHIWWFTQAKIFWLYLKLVVWPWPLLLHYQLPYVTTPFEVCLYVVPLVLLGIGTLVLLWRNHPVGFLGTWVFAILSPTFVIPVVTEMAAERRMYLPLAALVIPIVVGFYVLAEAYLPRWMTHPQTIDVRVKSVHILPLVLALMYGGISAERLNAYQEPIKLWQQVLQFQSENDTAHSAIGKYLDDAGDWSAAITHFREAVRLKPDLPQARNNLGVLLMRTNAYEEAAVQFAEGARLSPDDVRMLDNLSGALLLTGRNEESLVALHTALRLSPDDWTLHNNMGEALKNLGRNQEAIESYQEALRLNPGAVDLYNDIADNYFKLDQNEKAIAALERGLELAKANGDSAKIESFAKRIHSKR
jgi:tetratricopeptide (TPR) repeat protein